MKKNGSILIFVLFILIATSLFSLLIFKYLKNLLIRSSTYYKFEKTYRLSYGGIQLEFTKTKYHGPGFEEKISSGSQTNKKNRLCKSCFVETTNKSLSKTIGGDYFNLEHNIENCENLPQNHRINLNKGEGILIPLFKDNSNSTIENKFEGNNLQPINNFSPLTIYRDIPGSYFIIGITNGTKAEVKKLSTDNSGKKTINFNFVLDTKTFLGLIQDTNTTTKYCLQFNEKVPTNRNYIKSYAKYKDFSITLRGIKYKAVPSFIIYSIIK